MKQGFNKRRDCGTRLVVADVQLVSFPPWRTHVATARTATSHDTSRKLNFIGQVTPQEARRTSAHELHRINALKIFQRLYTNRRV